jgi:hypothetical protein
VKRKAVGIWGCKDCGKVKAGGAYTMKYVLKSSYSVYIAFSVSLVVMRFIICYFAFPALPVRSLSEAQSGACGSRPKHEYGQFEKEYLDFVVQPRVENYDVAILPI